MTVRWLPEGIHLITVTGRVDIGNGRILNQVLGNVSGRRGARMIVDLNGVTGELVPVMLHVVFNLQGIRRRHDDLVVVCTVARLLRFFETSSPTAILGIVPNLRQARRLLAGAKAPAPSIGPKTTAVAATALGLIAAGLIWHQRKIRRPEVL
ncbi:hypothetical protein GCM10009745_55260 [Kribbella yunnanensis]|uniref:STAS domain-containing protein n=1 Tax=Kribbella yunnanensis TaxID=190194 RepID=A0ABN2IAI9_9ACTN